MMNLQPKMGKNIYEYASKFNFPNTNEIFVIVNLQPVVYIVIVF